MSLDNNVPTNRGNPGATGRNYADLMKLYKKYHEQGLEILAFPCNDFLYQENGSNEQIQEFVKEKGAEFPVFGKVVCEYGEQTYPLYKFLKYNAGKSKLTWNFGKFLCDHNGVPVKRFGTSETMVMETDIQTLLAKAPKQPASTTTTSSTATASSASENALPSQGSRGEGNAI